MAASRRPTPDPKRSPTSVEERLALRRKKREERTARRARGEEGPRRRASPGRSRRYFFDEEEPAPRRRPPTLGPEPERYPIEFPPGALDLDAEKVVRRLTTSGHEAYLVGGCVRDLLVGHRPKDFDVATSARPEEVRALFRNSRIIGRRFRLVHVLFPHGHVVETATFRRNPPSESQGADDSLLIISDNFFGEAHEDAQRRDFTINGLFYDVEQQTVLDWVGGMEHIKSRTLQTIGDPIVRFQEDPVRMLRAVKFAARIDFGIAPEVYDAAVQCRGALAMAARPRLSEEVLRLMRGGASQRSIWLLWEMGLLDVLLPELSVYLADAADDRLVWALLVAVDRETKRKDGPLDDVVLWSALLLQPLLEAIFGEKDRTRTAHEFLEPIVERLNLPRKMSDAIVRIVTILPRLENGRSSRLRKSALLPLAQQVAVLRKKALASVEGESPVEEEEAEPEAEARPSRRRRRSAQ